MDTCYLNTVREFGTITRSFGGLSRIFESMDIDSQFLSVVYKSCSDLNGIRALILKTRSAGFVYIKEIALPATPRAETYSKR